MMETLNESFFVNVTTPAASEPDTVSPFPSVDDESLISGNSIETEQDSLDEVSTSSYDDDDDDSSSSSSESSAPPLPEDIGYVIDANGVSLLANLNRKMMEHRYGPDYQFDKVPESTKIDVGDAVDASSVGGEKNRSVQSGGGNVDMDKIMENLTKEDLQVLYKAVMGRELPEDDTEEREEGETRRGNDDTEEPSKPAKKGFGFLKKKLSIFKRGKKKDKSAELRPAETAKKVRRTSSPFQAAVSSIVNSRASKILDEERDAPEDINPSSEAELVKAPIERSATPISVDADIVETHDDSPRDVATPTPEQQDVEEEEASVEDVAVDAVSDEPATPVTEIVEESLDDQGVGPALPTMDNEKASGEESVVNGDAVGEAQLEADEPAEDAKPTIEQPILNTHSDLVSVVCDVSGNGAEVEVIEDQEAIELTDVPHILPEAPVSPTAAEYIASLADQGEKNIGRRIGKALRGKKSKSSASSPLNEMMESEDVKLTPENPVIEIPLSEVKPRKSLMSKYREKKPKFNCATSPKSAAAELPSPLKKKSSQALVIPEAAADIDESNTSSEPKKKKTSSGASVKSTKSKRNQKPEAAAETPSPLKKKSSKALVTPEAAADIDESNTSYEPTKKKKASSGASVKSTKSKRNQKPKGTTDMNVTKKTPRGMDDSEQDIFVVKGCLTDDSARDGFGSLSKDSDMESFEEAGGLMFCGMGKKNDWLTGVEQSFTQMFDYCDHTPEEAYENTKVYKDTSGEDESVSSRFSKIHSRSSRSRGERSARRSPSNRSIKSRGDKSTRSKSRSDKSVSEKTTRSRSKAGSDKSVGEKSARSRSKSVKSAKSESRDVKSAVTKSTNDSSEKKTNKSSSQSTSGKLTEKVSNTAKSSPAKKIATKKTTPTKTSTTKSKSAAPAAKNKTKSTTVEAAGKKN